MRSIAILMTTTMLAVSSCTLLVSTSDLRNGSEPSAPSDGGSPVGDGGDKPPLSDSAATPSDADSAALTGCARFVPAPSFCSDFDTNAKVDEGFPTKTLNSGASIEFSDAQFFSSPRSAHFTMKAPAEGALKRTVSPLGAKIHFELRIRFEKIGTNGSAQVMRIAQTVGTEFRALILYVSANRVLFQEDPPLAQYDFDPLFTTQRWYHLAFDLTSGPASVFTGTVDGRVVLAAQSIRPRDPNAPAEIGVGGIYFFQSTSDWDFTVDDVMVDQK